MKFESKLRNKKKKKAIWFYLIILFILASLFLMRPIIHEVKSSMRSQTLKKVITKEDNVERLDYVDENGAIRMAADAGFATSISTYNESSKLEEYFDENGQPIARYNRYYALLREYDENNHNYRITYLGIDGKPTATYYGYSVLVRTFTDDGEIKTEKYYDAEGNQVNTNTYGCGFVNEYDDAGNVIKVTYLDANDKPAMTSQGYSIVTRTYYGADSVDAGKVENEFYFDTTENPIALALGQYGVHKADYDAYGNNAETTYLDVDGNKTVTNRGYTTVIRTYKANNAVESERFFDIEGNPYKLSDGQYGVKYVNDQTVYLDKDGRTQFNLRRLFYNHEYLVALIAAIAVIVSVLSSRNANILYLVVYLVALAYFTLLFRESGSIRVNLTLFWSYKAAVLDKDFWSDILRNIWLFIPLGAILYKMYPKKIMLLVPLMLSTGIEVTQYVTGIGYFELDDILNNSIGGAIGYGAGELLTSASTAFKEKLFHWQEKSAKTEKKYNNSKNTSLVHTDCGLPVESNKEHSPTPLDDVAIDFFNDSFTFSSSASSPVWTTICKAISASLLGKSITIDDIDWQELFIESKKQAVSSIVRNGTKKHLPAPLSTEWKLYSIQEISFAVQLLEAQKELITLLDNHNIPHVILKGSTAAIYYPKPYFRSMGDVDFWVAPTFFDTAVILLKKNGFVESDGSDFRHLKLYKDNVLFEMHRHFSIDDADASIDEYIGRVEFVRGSIHDFEFWMLPDLENGLVLLDHLRQHLYEGLGLRQMLDWMMYVNAILSSQEAWEKFKPHAASMHLERLALVATRLCVKYFDLNAPWCGIDDGIADMLMASIIQSGNFGKNNGRGLPIEKTMINFRKEGMFKYLQKAGEFNWRNTLVKYPYLRPFAWIYQIGRYIKQAKKGGCTVSSLKDDIKRSNERYELLKALELL